MRYPEPDKIPDPSEELPADLVARIAPILSRTVVRFRTGREVGKTVLTDAAAEIFKVLLSRRSSERPTTVESVRESLNRDTDTALAYAHHIHKLAGGGRMLFLWHKAIEKRLAAEAEEVETQWWEQQAKVQNRGEEAHATPASEGDKRTAGANRGELPRHPATPDTPTARRIEAFRRQIEAASARKVSVADMCTFCGYTDATMFQRVQRESKAESAAARRNVERMLNTSAEEFWRVVDAKRQKFTKPPKSSH